MLEEIKAACQAFLVSEFGAHGQAANPDGLRTIALGNPELAVQGALLGYLRHVAGMNAVQECGIADGRDVDLIVFDQQWAPACVIELKHRMSNQGPLRQLIDLLEADRLRHAGSDAAGLPLLQLGLYTEISERPQLAPLHGLYRFLCAGYFRGAPRHTLTNQQLDAMALAAPDYTSIRVGDKTVMGRVGYCTRTVTPQT